MDVRSKTSWSYRCCIATQAFCYLICSLVIACGAAPTAPLLKSAKFFKSSASDDFVPLNLDGTGTVAVPAGASFLVLEFDQPLDGDVIETVQCHKVNGNCQKLGGGQYLNDVTVVDSFVPVSGVVTVSVANAKVSYRPDGGYNPPSSTLYDKWPNPGIRVDFPAVLSAGVVTVTLTTAIKGQGKGGLALPQPITFTFKVQ